MEDSQFDIELDVAPDDPCIVQMTCGDAGCQAKAMNAHSLTPQNFQTLVTAGQTRQAALPKSYSVQVIRDAINDPSVACDSYVSFGQADMNNQTDNSDLDFQVLAAPAPPGVTFSIFLFRGILEQTNAQSFDFYKAIPAATMPGAGAPTVCFSTSATLSWDISIRRPLGRQPKRHHHKPGHNNGGRNH